MRREHKPLCRSDGSIVPDLHPSQRSKYPILNVQEKLNMKRHVYKKQQIRLNASFEFVNGDTILNLLFQYQYQQAVTDQ
jgi:hypothetical protein